MKYRILLFVSFGLPLVLLFADVGLGIRRHTSFLESALFSIDSVFVSSKHVILSPFAFVRFQNDGARKLSNLEEKYANLLVKYQEKGEINQTGENQGVMRRLVLSERPVVYAGISDGINEGSAVLYEGVYVGRVVRSSQHISIIDLVSDLQGTLRVVQNGGNNEGILRKYQQTFRIEQLSWDVLVKEGDVFVTYGTTNGVPANIPVCEVIKSLGNTSDPTQTVEVRLLYMPKHADVVTLIQND